MNLSSQFFSGFWLAMAAALAGVLLWRAVRAAVWTSLAELGRMHAWLGAIVVLMVMWSLNASAKAGLNLHLLGAGAATLIFGRDLALAGIALVAAGTALNGDLEWSSLGLNVLVMGVLPVTISHGLRRIVERRLPANYFVYVFVQAFLGCGVGIMAVGAVASVLLALAGAFPSAELLEDYLPFFLLLAFSEAWLSGMVMTLLVVYRPAWVASFDDQMYLNK